MTEDESPIMPDDNRPKNDVSSTSHLIPTHPEELNHTYGPFVNGNRSHQVTFDRIMITVFVITIAGTCFLISSHQGTEVGHQPWKPGSFLRVVAQLMALNYQYPTPRGVDVKWLVQGLGAAAALLVAGVAWYVRTRREDANLPHAPCRRKFDLHGTDLHDTLTTRDDNASTSAARLARITPAGAAQITLLLYVGWMMLSSTWAAWPEAALGEGVRHLIVCIWAIALGRTLSRCGVRNAATALVIVLVLMAALGIWYHAERNPLQRLKFPIGNPIFLGACLLPGIMLSIATLIYWLTSPNHSGQPADETPTDSGSPPSQRPVQWRLYIGAALALVILLWAFGLTESRSPAVGLIVGVAGTAIIAANRRHRWTMIVIALLVVFAIGFWTEGQLETLKGGRGATIRLRLHSWRYAMDLFLEKPVIGQGQGGYLLLAQPMSRQDAERDPAAFPGPLLGHAHNEWLEVTADLGSIGIALCLTALGLTVWSAMVALRTLPDARDRWCLLGLLAGFVALFTEEAADVALRMPGLPVIFYAVIGLIWALSRCAVRPTGCPTRSLAKPIRLAGIVSIVVGVTAIVSLVTRDWQGALADQKATTHAKKQQWEQAVQQSRIATSRRLVIEDRLFAGSQLTQAARFAAAAQSRRLRTMLDRSAQAALSRTTILHLAAEDSARFTHYFDIGLETGSRLLKRIGTYPHVSGWLANLWLMRQQIEQLQVQIGLRDSAGDYRAEIAHWTQLEYDRDPCNVEAALSLLQLSHDRLLAERIDILRKPLRTGPTPRESIRSVEAALANLIRDPQFRYAIPPLLIQAKQAMDQTDPNHWNDWYAPETLRLVAIAHMLQGEFALAAQRAGQAATLYERIRQKFPHAVAYARLEQAHYLLLAHPEDAQRAVATCREAIANWPPVRLREQELAHARQALATYLLAADNPAAARQTLRKMNPSISDEDLNREIGLRLGEMCHIFSTFQPDRRPAAFDRWLQESLALVPNWSTTHLIAAGLAFERDNEPEAIEHLEKLEQILDNPNQMASILQSLLTRIPRNEALRAFAASRLKELPPLPETQPSSTAPSATGPSATVPSATQPATTRSATVSHRNSDPPRRSRPV